jgi:TonB family protein
MVEPKKAKVEPKKVKKVKKEPDFDPFAPVQSHRSEQRVKHTAPHIDKAELMGRQLSSREMERYIAMMQSAVQRQWKVPHGFSRTRHDPLVRVELNRNGSIRKITVLESSGQSSLDQTLIAAIRAAAPFTLPREQYSVFKSNEIRFHPRKP